jgi:hypothetical protein
MLDSETREFTARDGTAVAFKVSHLPATKGLVMLGELAKMFGPSLGILVDSAGGLDAKASLAAVVTQKSQGDVFARVAMELFGRMDIAKIQTLVNQLRGVTEVSGGEGTIPLERVYEARFRGDQLLQLKWLAFALEVQFGDFLSLRGALALGGSNGVAAAPQT